MSDPEYPKLNEVVSRRDEEVAQKEARSALRATAVAFIAIASAITIAEIVARLAK